MELGRLVRSPELERVQAGIRAEGSTEILDRRQEQVSKSWQIKQVKQNTSIGAGD